MRWREKLHSEPARFLNCVWQCWRAIKNTFLDRYCTLRKFWPCAVICPQAGLWTCLFNLNFWCLSTCVTYVTNLPSRSVHLLYRLNFELLQHSHYAAQPQTPSALCHKPALSPTPHSVPRASPASPCLMPHQPSSDQHSPGSSAHHLNPLSLILFNKSIIKTLHLSWCLLLGSKNY